MVTDLRVNCEQNSLLITVRQLGAVCHDGYRSCYYRRLNDDDSLTIAQSVEEQDLDRAQEMLRTYRAGFLVDRIGLYELDGHGTWTIRDEIPFAGGRRGRR